MNAPGALTAADSGPPPRARPARLHWPRTLRGKGLLALGAALVYLVAVAWHVSQQRAELNRKVGELQVLHRYERALARAEVAVYNAGLEVQEAAFGPIDGGTPVSRSIALAIESATRSLDALEEHETGSVRRVRAVERAFQALRAAPLRANWLELRETLRRIQEDLTIQRDKTAHEREALTERYQQVFRGLTLEMYGLVLAGFLVFGAGVVAFFARLTRDLARLQQRAAEIVRGERLPPLPVERDDELGRLTHAVNRMAEDLDARARQLELEDQRRAHQEKMASLGALAAGVAHEINNPLATIAGIAQHLTALDAPLPVAAADAHGRQLLAETQRVAGVTRQIADLAAPRPADLPWLDLNAMLQPLLHFVRYDRRYRRIEFVEDLAPALPAVRALGDPVELVLMRLLAAVADAVAAREARGARVAVATRAVADGVELVLADDSAVPTAAAAARAPDDRAFEVCAAIIEPLGGTLRVERDGARLRRIALVLPAEPSSQAETTR
jgi:nitrogen-specific signal transduction histidine kinase